MWILQYFKGQVLRRTRPTADKVHCYPTLTTLDGLHLAHVLVALHCSSDANVCLVESFSYVLIWAEKTCHVFLIFKIANGENDAS